MEPSEKSTKIAVAFLNYVKTGDKALIEKYALEEIRHAKYQYANQQNKLFYKPMEERIIELEHIQSERRSKREKWKDRLIGFVFALIVFVVCAYLKSCLKLGG